jgi:hypothetical protein
LSVDIASRKISINVEQMTFGQHSVNAITDVGQMKLAQPTGLACVPLACVPCTTLAQAVFLLWIPTEG